jgi:hypothetical protein
MVRRRIRYPALCAAAAVLAAAVAACTGAGAATPVTPAAERVPVLLRTADLRLPLDDYQPSLADAGRLARADRALLRQCMREFGFDYTAPDPAAVPGPRTWNERRYGLTDPAQAAHGYWPESRVAVQRPRSPALPAAESAALTGTGAGTVHGRPVPAGGCAADAQRRLTARDPAGADRSLAQQLGSTTFFGSQQDPRVRAATEQWAGCMRAAGHPYAGPLDPPKDARFSGPGPAGAVELATARADVECKRRTNLVGVWFTVEAGQQRALIDTNRPALELASSALRAELSLAAEFGTL